MAQRPVQPPGIAGLQPLEKAAREAEDPPFGRVVRVAEQPRGEHRGDRQRGQQADHHRRGHGEREFAQHPAHHPAHEDQRHENREQAERDGQHGKSHLARAFQRGRDRAHPVLDMAGDILDYHDRVIDHEAGRDGQRHQREIVEQEARQIHHPQRPRERGQHRRRRNSRRPPALQEQADHHHHQQRRDQQRDLDLVERGADGDGPVGHHFQRNVGGQQRAQAGDLRLQRIDRGDDIGIGLPGDQHLDRALAVEQPHGARVFRAIEHLGHVRQPHRRAIAPGHHQRGEVAGLQRGLVRIDLPGHAVALAVDPLDRAARAVRAGRLQGGADVFQPDPGAGQLERIDLDPHARQRGAAEFDIADPLHLQQLLLDDVRDRIVDLRRGADRRGHGQDQDRRVGRVDLAVGRVGLEAGGQVGAGRGDGRLHVARGAIDIARKVE